MKNKLIAVLLFVITFISCNKKKEEFAKLEYNKIFNFGKITLNDTVRYAFKIKNISDTDFKIKQIGTSCGCTAAKITDSTVSKNETIEIKVKFVPKKEDKGLGLIKNSIVIDGNTNPPFTTFYITGKVE